MERVILHSDMNNFYASVECLHNPSLRGKPVAVAGDSEARHGIVLAKNYEAKKFGVATGNPLWLAKQKCPEIIFVPPNYELYMRYSQIARELYGEYTDRVESYGMDECWLDVTESENLFGDGKRIADTLRERIRSELGVTASIGVSFNKIFAKLGSDMQKPDATTVIDRRHFRESVWPLPAGELLFVGPSTKKKLGKFGIHTIGDIARAETKELERLLGKNGRVLWLFANGHDNSPVAKLSQNPVVKSVGNGTTAPRDLIGEDDIRIILTALCESVSSRLRAQGLICSCVQLGARYSDLKSYEKQGPLEPPCRSEAEIFKKALSLYTQSNIPGKPVRSLTVRACGLSYDENPQLTLFQLPDRFIKSEIIDSTIDRIRERFGHFTISRCRMLTDRQLSDFEPAKDGQIHPELFFKSY